MGMFALKDQNNKYMHLDKCQQVCRGQMRLHWLCHTHLKDIVFIHDVIKQGEHTVDVLDELDGTGPRTDVWETNQIAEHDRHLIKGLQEKRRQS